MQIVECRVRGIEFVALFMHKINDLFFQGEKITVTSVKLLKSNIALGNIVGINGCKGEIINLDASEVIKIYPKHGE